MIAGQNTVRLAYRVTWIGIFSNLLLTIFKGAAGLIASSVSMVSDALHSASDLFSDFLVLIGIRISSKEADREHPYGHERMECVVAIVLAMLLFLTGGSVGIGGIHQLIKGKEGVPIPGNLALWAALLSVLVKEWLFWYTYRAARKLGSVSMLANAWHHRFDALSSVGSFWGILGARRGVWQFEPIACLFISLLILKAAFSVWQDAMQKMVDHACRPSLEAEMRQCIQAIPGVQHIDAFSTRMFGDRIYVDVDIAADAELSLERAHAIAQLVHDQLEKRFPQVKHCMVHVNPLFDKV